MVSSGNFLLNVLLARTLSEEDYGEFALFLGAIYILPWERSDPKSLFAKTEIVKMGRMTEAS